jgi:hypothetical protein
MIKNIRKFPLHYTTKLKTKNLVMRKLHIESDFRCLDGRNRMFLELLLEAVTPRYQDQLFQ